MELNKNTVSKIIFILFATVAFCIGLINLSSVWDALNRVLNIFTPIIIGLCIAFLLDPLASFLETKAFGRLRTRFAQKGKSAARALGIFIALIIVAGVIALIILLVVPEIEEAFTIIANTLPASLAKLIGNINALLAKYEIVFRIPTDNLSEWTDLLFKATDYLQHALDSGTLSDIASTAFSLLAGFTKFFLGVVLSIYVLMQKERIGRFATRLVRAYSKDKTAARIFKFANLTRVSFRNYVTGQLTEAMILSMLCFIGMLIFRFPYPTAASAVIGVSAFIPIFGAWIGAVLGALLSLSQSPMKALLFIVFIIVLQQIEGNLIYPRVVGKSVGLPGILVLISVLIGAGAGGIIGMILAVPICSIVTVLVRESIEKRLMKKKVLTELADMKIISPEEPEAKT